MLRRLIIVIFFTLIVSPVFSYNAGSDFIFYFESPEGNDTIKENQILYNGRVWRNLYYRIKDNQFLFSSEFLPGNLTIDSKTFENLQLRYDIYNDEIMTISNNGMILQLNKEKIDSFSLVFANRKYRFINAESDSAKGYGGYLNILYSGKSDLAVKYEKDIELLAVDKKFDLFYQSHRIFFVTDNKVFLVNGKGDIFKAVPESKDQLKEYIKKNRLVISKKNPESFIPLIRYYDSIKK